jgi:hypothetical protein
MGGPVLNLYPVKVTTDDGRVVRNCRLVAEDNQTTVWVWDTDAGTATVLTRAPGAPERLGATQSFAVAGMRVDPQRGCGCSHPMYRWVPPA